MKRVLLLGAGLAVASAVLTACGGGGGGGGGTSTVVGRVVSVVTGGPPNPASSVQIGARSTLTSLADGSFQLPRSGASVLTVDSLGLGFGVFAFAIPPGSGVVDVGDLWIGPERVTVTGVVRNATDNAPIAGAIVSFAGRQGTTTAAGVFTLEEVAYSSANQAAFWGIAGSARAPGFFRREFSAQPNLASGGVVNVGDILLTPTSDPNPPGFPFNIWGIVSAPGGAVGSVVRLRQGGVDVRVTNVGPDGRYFFFVLPGNYQIVASKGASTAPPIDVTLNEPNEVIQRNVVIP
ncbi:MAG: hypothetical protein SNJ74_02040 [Fimbriimonadaceae bacterium]